VQKNVLNLYISIQFRGPKQNTHLFPSRMVLFVSFVSVVNRVILMWGFKIVLSPLSFCFHHFLMFLHFLVSSLSLVILLLFTITAFRAKVALHESNLDRPTSKVINLIWWFIILCIIEQSSPLNRSFKVELGSICIVLSHKFFFCLKI
jgi:hypothetical protein